MRKLVIFIIYILILCFSCKREENRVDKVFSEFDGMDGVYMLKLPPSLFLVLLQKYNYNNVNDVSFDGVDLVRLMKYNKTESNGFNKTQIIKDLISGLEELQFEDLLKYSESGNEVIVKVFEKDGYTSDLIILFNDNESVTLIGITGKMEIGNITKLAAEIDFKSMKNIQFN
jgi:hypothetical protein